MLLHTKQREVVGSKARFKIIRAGRRSGKTALKMETMLFLAMSGNGRNIFYIAPTQIQARGIIWEALKTRIGKAGEANEDRLEMRVPTVQGGVSLVKIAGWENRENFRGLSADHIEFDEVDTMRDFFVGWQEIFRPALMDRLGTASFGGTPKKENPNLRRLEKEAEKKIEWETFHFTTADNPFIDPDEIQNARIELDAQAYKQEILAEYVENAGALFGYTALVDMFTNTVTKTNEKYLSVDIAGEGTDKTIYSFWNGLELYRIEIEQGTPAEMIINQIREYAAMERIPYSHIVVDAVGIGAGVATSSLLKGVVGFKSSYAAMRVDIDIVKLPNVHYLKNKPLTSEYRNLRSQCVFMLSENVNTHKVSIKTEDARVKSAIIEELSQYQDVSVGDGKRFVTEKDDVKDAIGRSPDISDTLIMRMYFELIDKLIPGQDETSRMVADKIQAQFSNRQEKYRENSTR